MILSEKGRIIKNLISFSTVYLFLFSAVNTILSLQSALNQDKGLGVISSALAFSVQLITCLVLPQFVADLIGFKWTLVISETLYLLYVASNFYPRYYTSLPGSALMGLAQSLAWTVFGIYFQILSKNYSTVTKASFLSTQNLFLGIFGAIFMISSSLGSFLVAVILKPDVSYLNQTISKNSTNAPFNYTLYCGYNHCPKNYNNTGENLSNSGKTSQESIYILIGTLISFCLFSILITLIFVDNIKIIKKDNEVEKKTKNSLKQMLKQEFLNLFILTKNVDFYLLIPLAIYAGYELTFMWAEFNQAFVSCIASVNFIGWTNILYGGVGAFFSFFFGYIAKYTTRFPIIILVLSVSMGVSLFVITWTPNPEATQVLFFVYVAFAFSQSVIAGQLRGIYGVQFPGNYSAFSAVTLFQTIGFISGFISSIFLCTAQKNYIYLGLTFLSFITYGGLSVKNSYKEQKALKHKEKLKFYNHDETLLSE